MLCDVITACSTCGEALRCPGTAGGHGVAFIVGG